jgi:hypothetical protein
VHTEEEEEEEEEEGRKEGRNPDIMNPGIVLSSKLV